MNAATNTYGVGSSFGVTSIDFTKVMDSTANSQIYQACQTANTAGKNYFIKTQAELATMETAAASAGWAGTYGAASWLFFAEVWSRCWHSIRVKDTSGSIRVAGR